MRTFSPAQHAYLLAKASYDLASAAADAHMAAYEAAYEAATAGMTEAEVAAYDAHLLANDRPSPILVAQCDALDVLRKAERALLDWCAATVLPLARTEEQRTAIESVRTVKPFYTAQYAKAIDLAMRLDA